MMWIGWGVKSNPRDYYRSEHARYKSHEAVANTFRNQWYVWFFLATFLVGDVDIF